MWKEYLEEHVRAYSRENQQTPARLPREFFTRDGLTVGRELLGKILVHETGLGPIRGVITEVESYMGIHDKGSHTYGGRRTNRTEPMFHKGGTSYVYFTYGMYHCMNIATGQEEDPQAVLIRSVVPADEQSKQRMLALRMEFRQRKSESDPRKAILKNLANGPGKLCIAMGISKAENDMDMVESDCFYVTQGILVQPEEICAGKRIGIDYAEEAADYPWRFFLK